MEYYRVSVLLNTGGEVQISVAEQPNKEELEAVLYSRGAPFVIKSIDGPTFIFKPEDIMGIFFSEKLEKEINPNKAMN